MDRSQPSGIVRNEEKDEVTEIGSHLSCENSRSISQNDIKGRNAVNPKTLSLHLKYQSYHRSAARPLSALALSGAAALTNSVSNTLSDSGVKKNSMRSQGRFNR